MTFQLIVRILLLLIPSACGYTSNIASYNYTSSLGADPTTQGWTYLTNVTNNVYLSGYDASIYPGQSGWRIVDGTSTGYANYQITLTDDQTEAMKTGFSVSWTFKLDATAWKNDGTGSVTNYYLPPYQSRQNNNGLWIETAGENSFRYYIVATADASGNLAINDGTVTHVLTAGGGNNGYDTLYTVTVAYDGTKAVLSYGGSDFTLTKQATFGNNRVLFGAHTSPGQGSVVYHEVLFGVPDSVSAVNIRPANGATRVETTAILEWSAPLSYTPTGYDVYFGTNPDAAANPKVLDNALQTTYDPDLAYSTTYYWQVDAYEGTIKHPGRIWSFTTRPEHIIKVACVGDSITYGYGIPDIGTNSYPAQLQALLGAYYQVGNFGRSGARVSQISSNPYKGSPEYYAAMAFEPDIVFIALGINDCSVNQWQTNKPVFAAHYKDLISDFKNLSSHPQIYIGTLMPVFCPPYPYPAIYSNMAECSPLIEQVAAEEKLPLIDLYTPLESHSAYYAVDGLHPDRNGAQVIAQTVYRAIKPDVYISHCLLSVKEEGATSDAYTIVLGGIPKQDVAVTLTPSDPEQVLIKVNGMQKDTIVFTPANCSQPQTISLTAVDDRVFEGTHTVVISHICSSDDWAYDNLVIPDVSVNIADNDYYGKRVKVFLIGGQSNAAGSGLNTEYPALYQTPQNDVEFWVGGRLPGDGVPDYSVWDRPADTAFRPLQLGSGNYPAGTHSGFEMSLGRALKDALPYDNIALVKYGMSGSALMRGLRSSDGAGDWDPGPPNWSPSEGFDGVRYHIFRTSGVLPALQAIVNRGDLPEIAGMFWMQGETDAGSSAAASQYEANLKKFIEAVRTDFGAPEMRFFIGRIRTVTGIYNAAVRTAMQEVAASDPLVMWIDTDDLPVNADNVHYSAAGLVELGRRFADAYLRMASIQGDLEPDGAINLADFSRFAEQWLSVNCGFCFGADLNSDLDVNMDDLTLLTDQWLDGSVSRCAARWAMDENSGNTAIDKGPNRYDGTLINFPSDNTQWMKGIFGNALHFDGIDDYVVVPGYKGISGTASRTCSVWIKTIKPGSQILNWGTSLTGQKWTLRINNDGTLRAEVQDGYMYGTTYVADGNWHHVAVVLADDGSPDISEAVLFVDGQPESIGGVLPCSVHTAADSDVLIGVNLIGTVFFEGLLDEVRIYTAALDSNDIQNIMNR
ncbi:MAG TPA: sialate O-acetylesterase [Anaerohalosphaeraceae bacterium]|nr:sialate O-acetylesterase [Anaerohalosphaeraceae bacterium]